MDTLEFKTKEKQGKKGLGFKQQKIVGKWLRNVWGIANES